MVCPPQTHKICSTHDQSRLKSGKLNKDDDDNQVCNVDLKEVVSEKISMCVSLQVEVDLRRRQ
jgi:hypothetical protein